MRKSVEDLLTGSGEMLGSGLNQAISFTTGLQSSPSTLRKRITSNSEKQTPGNNSSGSTASGSTSKGNRNSLSVSYNSDRNDGSEESRSGKLSDSSPGTQQGGVLAKSASATDIERPIKLKVPEKAKKKSWYSVLYPTYKSRSDDFKKLFRDVPDSERLVVDYSCALQREILAQGRLYVSQNYLCFHANIFGWETLLTIKWKDVRAVTKGKTALVIPNAILICTESDKHFFTSFATRDNSYLMLFRVWQNALMDKQMQPQEMWLWVHNCYGDELGLTSEDEDYIDPYGHSDDASAKPTLTSSPNATTDSVSESQSNPENDNVGGSGGSEYLLNDLVLNDKPSSNSSGGARDPVIEANDLGTTSGTQQPVQQQQQQQQQLKRMSKNSRSRGAGAEDIPEHIPTDMSDTSDSEQDKNLDLLGQAECTSNHEGRQMIHTILPINVDILFTLLFSKSKFLENFHANRRTTDLVFGEWIQDEDNRKIRTVTLTVALTQPVGPKVSHVTEKQTLRDCSVPSQLYSVDIISTNGGIPYADSFFVTMHYCMVRTVDDHTMFSVHAHIQYKKSVWGVVKGFIEKNTWNGLEDFYTALVRALQTEYGIPPAKAKSRRTRRVGATQPKPIIDVLESAACRTVKTKSATLPFYGSSAASKMQPSPEIVSKVQYKSMSIFVIILLILLIILNIVLYFKLWDLEKMDANRFQYPDFTKLSPIYMKIFRDPPKSHEDWIKIMQEQEALHNAEMSKWQSVLQIAVDLLRKVSVVCKKIVKNSKAAGDDPGGDDDEENSLLDELFFGSSGGAAANSHGDL